LEKAFKETDDHTNVPSNQKSNKEVTDTNGDQPLSKPKAMLLEDDLKLFLAKKRRTKRNIKTFF